MAMRRSKATRGLDLDWGGLRLTASRQVWFNAAHHKKAFSIFKEAFQPWSVQVKYPLHCYENPRSDLDDEQRRKASN